MAPAQVDPVTFEVVWHRLLDITEEMGIRYMRTSGSPILVGAYDASTGITLPSGELVAMGPYITTQAHVLSLIIDSVLELEEGPAGISDGEMYICNDPYLGATHQPDVATVAPFYYDGELRAWVGSSGHWLDIGGPEVGGFNMNARSVYDEGLRMPPTRIVESGQVREDIVRLIMNQLREPLAELDLRGQIVANRAGCNRMTDLYDDFGPAVVDEVMRSGITDVERRLRRRLRNMPDGVWRDVQFLDHDGHRSNLRKIVCTATKRNDTLRFDFTGTDPQVAGFANCTFGGLRAAVLSAVCVALGFDMAWNDGVSRCVEIVAPPGTAVTAIYPTPVSLSTISAIILTLNLTIRTLSHMLLTSSDYRDEAMAGWCGTSLGVSIVGRNERGVMTVCPEASHFAAGCGARTYADGVDTGGIIINTTANIPSVEETESEYPVLYLFRRQLTDSGGPGRFRGGVSAGVALVPHRARSRLESSFAGVGAMVPNGFGIAGGLPGASVRYLRFEDAGSIAELAETGGLPGSTGELSGKRSVVDMNSSQSPFPDENVEYHNWQGGGGFGDPLERDLSAVARDVLANLVSPSLAENVYGAVVRDGLVDEVASAARREEVRGQRLAATHLWKPPPDPEWESATNWLTETPSVGRVRFGDLVEIDFDRGVSLCIACRTTLSSARQDFRIGCFVDDGPTSLAGDVRGEDYENTEVRMLRFYCRGCGRQLAAEVTIPGAPLPRFAVATGPSSMPHTHAGNVNRVSNEG